jgi:hypothetical protein
VTTDSKFVSNRRLLLPSNPEMTSRGENINGPTVVQIRFGLLKKPFYLLFFAHHHGKFIRVAFSRLPNGPFIRIHAWGLHWVWNPLSERRGHVASPESVLVDGKRYLLTHSPSRRLPKQKTYAARLYLGFFSPRPRLTLLPGYARFFSWDKQVYAVTHGRGLYRIKGPDWRPQELELDVREAIHLPDLEASVGIRHPFILPIGDNLLYFFTRRGDSPERIFASLLYFNTDKCASLGKPIEVLRPEMPFEGSELPTRPSAGGIARNSENAVRDPFVLELDGKYILYYAVQAERGIACAELDAGKLVEALLSQS